MNRWLSRWLDDADGLVAIGLIMAIVVCAVVLVVVTVSGPP